MKRSDFHFELPDELIARQPAPTRTGSRLMVVDRARGLYHENFPHILDLLESDDLLVFNNTRVFPARFYGQKQTGGRIEVLIERILEPCVALAHVRASKSPGNNTSLLLDNGPAVKVVQRQGELFELHAERPWLELAEEIGHIPLPPYIDRPDDSADRERYQTVYSRHPGAVAAPTAGLHFDLELLEAIRAKGVNSVEITLHVGAGTFQPVRVEDFSTHKMHSEWMQLDAEAAELIRRTRNNGGRIVAVGTTSVRALETAGRDGEIKAYVGETDIFISPGYRFQIVDAMLTNFHLPESTLLMLVSAFSGYREILQAYQEAVRQRYRFFSYGDAMFLTRNTQARLPDHE